MTITFVLAIDNASALSKNYRNWLCTMPEMVSLKTNTEAWKIQLELLIGSHA